MSTALGSLEPSFAASIGSVLNLDTMERLLEDTSVDFLPSLIEVFEAESAQRVKNIQKNLVDQDYTALSVEAHSLKGTSATFGAEALRALSEKIEKSAKAGDNHTVERLVPEIPDKLDAVLAALHQFSDKLNG